MTGMTVNTGVRCGIEEGRMPEEKEGSVPEEKGGSMPEKKGGSIQSADWDSEFDIEEVKHLQDIDEKDASEASKGLEAENDDGDEQRGWSEADMDGMTDLGENQDVGMVGNSEEDGEDESLDVRNTISDSRSKTSIHFGGDDASQEDEDGETGHECTVKDESLLQEMVHGSDSDSTSSADDIEWVHTASNTEENSMGENDAGDIVDNENEMEDGLQETDAEREKGIEGENTIKGLCERLELLETADDSFHDRRRQSLHHNKPIYMEAVDRKDMEQNRVQPEEKAVKAIVDTSPTSENVCPLQNVPLGDGAEERQPNSDLASSVRDEMHGMSIDSISEEFGGNDGKIRAVWNAAIRTSADPDREGGLDMSCNDSTDACNNFTDDTGDMQETEKKMDPTVLRRHKFQIPTGGQARQEENRWKMKNRHMKNRPVTLRKPNHVSMHANLLKNKGYFEIPKTIFSFESLSSDRGVKVDDPSTDATRPPKSSGVKQEFPRRPSRRSAPPAHADLGTAITVDSKPRNQPKQDGPLLSKSTASYLKSSGLHSKRIESLLLKYLGPESDAILENTWQEDVTPTPRNSRVDP